jgi:hypothetical protein
MYRCCPFEESRLVSEWMDAWEAEALRVRVEADVGLGLMVEGEGG